MALMIIMIIIMIMIIMMMIPALLGIFLLIVAFISLYLKLEVFKTTSICGIKCSNTPSNFVSFTFRSVSCEVITCIWEESL
jgi:hypothetical protein